MLRLQVQREKRRSPILEEDDFSLIERFVSGDETAFEVLVRRYQQPIYQLLWRFVENHDDADELAQKTFVQVYRNLAKFKKNAQFSTWLYRIAINQAKNHFRDRKRFVDAEITEDALTVSPQVIDEMMAGETEEKLDKAIRLLPEKQRMTITLRIQENLPFKTIAEILKCSVNTAKVNFHHAVKKLKEELS